MAALTGKIALVTGASQGIGRGIALRLARDGATVIVDYTSSESAAQEVVKMIEEAGGTAVAIKADVSHPAEIETLFQTVLARFGGLDILVNNAGVATLMTLDKITEAEFDRVFNLNAKGTLFCLKEAALHLADNGRIINIASSTVNFPTEGAAIYAGSKAAVKIYTQVAARELGARGSR